MGIFVDRRYWVVASAIVIQAVIIGSMFAYGVFFEVLESELGWSRTLLSACTSVSFLVMGVLAVFAGRLSDRFGPRGVLSVTGLLFGLGYGLMYYMSLPWHLFALYGGLIGVGLSTHDVVTLSTVARWFDKRRGIMTGIVKVGTACGQIIVPLAATALIALFGWRMACVVLGASAAVLLLIAAQGMRSKPADTTPSASSRGAAVPSLTGSGLTYSQARRTRQLWTLCAVQFMYLPSLVTIPLHIVVHGTDLGLSTAHAAALLSTIGAVSIAGRLTVGTAYDRLGGRGALLICFSGLFASLIFLRFVNEGWMLFVFAAVYGFAHGGLFTVISPTVAEYFGTRAHGAIFGVIVFFGTLGGALGPVLAGIAFDNLGSYDIAFATLALMALVGLLLVASLRPLAVDAAPS